MVQSYRVNDMPYAGSTYNNNVVLCDNYSNNPSIISAPVVLDVDYMGVTMQSDAGGEVAGIITTKGVAQGSAKVLLYETVSKTLVAETITNGAGVFSFEGLNKNYEFFIVVIGLPTWEWRVKSRFKPV